MLGRRARCEALANSGFAAASNVGAELALVGASTEDTEASAVAGAGGTTAATETFGSEVDGTANPTAGGAGENADG